MHPPTSTLFPYTTLFRSQYLHGLAAAVIDCGGRIHTGNHVAHVEGGDDARVVTSEGRDHARVVAALEDRKSTRLNSSHANISYAVFCLKKKNKMNNNTVK